MMTISGLLEGLFMLFVSIHGFADLSVTCTASWLKVRVRRAPIVNNLQPQADEVFLGYGCPVSTVEENYFEFLYILSLCGIRVHEDPLAIYIESFIVYDPVHLDFMGHIPITCYIQRMFPINFVMKRREENSRDFKRPVGQKCSMSGETEYFEIYLGPLSRRSFPLLDVQNLIPSCEVWESSYKFWMVQQPYLGALTA